VKVSGNPENMSLFAYGKNRLSLRH